MTHAADCHVVNRGAATCTVEPIASPHGRQRAFVSRHRLRVAIAALAGLLAVGWALETFVVQGVFVTVVVSSGSMRPRCLARIASGHARRAARSSRATWSRCRP